MPGLPSPPYRIDAGELGAAPESIVTVPVLSYRHAGSNKLVVDLERLVAGKLLIQAASGGGKSWAVRQLVEELYGQVPIIILDPEGEFHTLREKYDFVLAALRGGDVEASPKTAPILARRLVEARGSAVIDLSEMKPAEQRQFVRRFLETLVALPRELWHATIIVVDEAHMFAPESGHGEAESLDAMADFGARSRKRGFCFVAATTRIAKFHKDVAANCHNKLIGFNSLDVDIDRAAKELGFSKEAKATIRQLEPGSFYAYGPAISKEVLLVRTGPVVTTHPKPGMTVAVAAAPPSSKLKKLIESSLADLPKEAEEEARTIDELRRSNADLSKKLRAAEKAVPAPVADTQAIDRAVARATGSVLRDANALIDQVRGKLTRFVQKLEKEGGAIEAQGRYFTNMSAELREVLPLPIPAKESGAGVRETSRASTSELAALKERETRPVGRVAPATPGSAAPVGDGSISGVGQKILNTIAALQEMGCTDLDKATVAALVGYHPNAKSYANAMGSLNTGRYVQYLSGGRVTLTAQGQERAVSQLSISSIDELHELWFDRLGNVAKKILEPLINDYPSEVGAEALAESAGYHPNAKSFANAKGRLRTLGLIEYPKPGYVVATKVLFPEGLN